MKHKIVCRCVVMALGSLQDEPLVHFLVITENTEVIVFGIALLPSNTTEGLILYTSTADKVNNIKEIKLDMK